MIVLPHRDDYTFEEEEQILLSLEEQDYEDRLLAMQETDYEERRIRDMGNFVPMTEEGIENLETSSDSSAKEPAKEEKE